MVMNDQTSPQFLSQLRNLARGFLDWAGEEQVEGHHPPDVGQHQQALQSQPMTTQPDADINEPPPYPQRAAGMLLMAPDGRTLFVRRQGDDHAGEWSLPGGMAKADEMPWQTARREANEELGQFDCGDTQLLDHNFDGRLGYTTYGGQVKDAFNPVLNHEHDAYQWATPDQAPQPLHPGLKATLDFALDPLTEKGRKILSSMKSQYGPEKGESVFYASRNSGKITGVDTPDAIPTTHRQDTGVGIPAPTVHPSGRGANPYSANIDNRQQHKLDFLPQTDAGWQSPQWKLQPDTWTSPDWDAGTPEGARKAAQTRGAGGAAQQPQPMQEFRHAMRAQQREPGIGNFLRMVGKSMKVNPTQHPTMESADNKTPMQRYKLFDSHSGVLYDIDKPVPRSNEPSQDDWGETQASDPLTKPAMSAPQQQSTGRTGGLPMRSAPQPGAPMGGGPGVQGGVGMNANVPKYSQSVKMSYPDGSVDERKMTRPGGPPPQQMQWQSPKWAAPSGQQQADASWPTRQPVTPRPIPDQGGSWPTAGSLGPSALGGTGH